MLVRGLSRDFVDLREIGGIWREAFESANRAGRHFVKFRLLAAWADLMFIANQEHREQLQRASDAELQDDVTRSLMRLIRAEPELVAGALNTCGWSVHPPSVEES